MTVTCNLLAPNAITLVFSGTTLGNHVHSWTPTPRRTTPIDERHNFWATTVVLDGSYPQLVWDHEFLVYTEPTTPNKYAFAKDFLAYMNYVTGDPQDLRLKVGSTTVVACGSCYLDIPSLSDPEDLLLYEAGIVHFKFIGTSIPSIPV